MSTHRLGRALLTALAVVAASAGLSGCGGTAKTAQDIAAVDVVPSKVDRVIFHSGPKTAEIKRVDGDWIPGTGARVESIALLDSASERLLPVNAYRIIDSVQGRPVDQNNPNYGLDKPSQWSMEVLDANGKDWKLSVGKPTFNQAGYYAKVDGDPRVFLIISKAVTSARMCSGRQPAMKAFSASAWTVATTLVSANVPSSPCWS